MRFAFVLAAMAALWVQPAQAANLSKFYLTGTITEQTSAGDPQPFGVGSTITLEGMADITDPQQTAIWGDTGYRFVGFFGNPTFKITIGGKEMHYFDDIFDNSPLFYDAFTGITIGAPAVFIKDGKIAGVVGYFSPAGDIPELLAGSGASGSKDLCGPDGDQICARFEQGLTDVFNINNGQAYENTYRGPRFKGIWNFEQSIASVPEPASWALMILGIGLAGAATRRHRTPSYARHTTRALAA